jgi:hypothetical protein
MLKKQRRQKNLVLCFSAIAGTHTHKTRSVQKNRSTKKTENTEEKLTEKTEPR